MQLVQFWCKFGERDPINFSHISSFVDSYSKIRKNSKFVLHFIFSNIFPSKNFFPQLLFRLYCFGLFLGGIYSVPPIRTKKNPLLAGLTIATVRGFLLNFGVYYAVKDAIGASFAWSPKVSFVARFMTIFATVIAVTKDLPDIEGDKVRRRVCFNIFFRKVGNF